MIGAGTAGCVLASRLTENPGVSVCLLEAGGTDSSVLIKAPLGFAATAPLGIHNWNYNTVPQAGLNGRREVILAAGAFGSPQLLMLSGIGPATQLQQHGIAVLHDLPGVGQNLHDHITAVLIYRTKRQEATFGWSAGGLATMVKGIFEWRKQRTGIITSNVAESQAFMFANESEPSPDIQLALCTGIVDDHTRKNHLGHGYTLHVTLLRPKSRGSVMLQSAKAQDAPLIDPQFLSDPGDLATLVKATQMGYDIMQAPALDGYRGPMLYPFNRNDTAQIERYLRDHSDTEYHPCGTCKMGPASDPGTVVDASLRVHGIERLRVVDASIMPQLISGNTNTPTVMIAEKASDFIKAELV